MEEDRGRIDELKRSLYRRGQSESKPRGWSRFTKKETDVQDDWKHDHARTEGVVEVRRPPQSRRSLSLRFFVFSVIFFLIALGVAGFIISRGSNIVSSENIDLTVSGPVSVAGGEALELQVDVVNRNNTTLEEVDLLIEFPEGTRDPETPSEELRRSRESLGDLTPGDSESRTISALLFGEENSKKEVKIGIEYRVVGSNAIFFKESVFGVQIGTAPVSVLINIPTEVNSGDDIAIVAEIISNTAETLEDVALSIEYPFGFSFKDAQPNADVGDNIWLIGDLAPQGRRTINITGTIEGQDTEERTFRFIAGLSDGVDTQALSTVLLEMKRSVAISRPFLQADLVLGGTAGDVHIGEPARAVSGTIYWQNNLPVMVEDVQIEVELQGEILDESSVVSTNGFYRSLDNTIFWDKSRYEQFASVSPGGRGQLIFEFRSIDPDVTYFEEGSIDLTLRITGNRIGDTPGTTGQVSSSQQKKVQFASRVTTGARALYSTGPFSNTGPFPPQAEQPTTYTILWGVTNTSNTLSDGKMSASLPDYMEWVGLVDPASELVTFNAVGREVEWDLGIVSQGSGYTRPPREVAFQVRIIPSISQVGSTPVLIGAPTFTARDTFTGTTHRSIGRELTTAVSGDPQYKVRYDQVVQ